LSFTGEPFSIPDAAVGTGERTSSVHADETISSTASLDSSSTAVANAHSLSGPSGGEAMAAGVLSFAVSSCVFGEAFKSAAPSGSSGMAADALSSAASSGGGDMAAGVLSLAAPYSSSETAEEVLSLAVSSGGGDGGDGGAGGGDPKSEIGTVSSSAMGGGSGGGDAKSSKDAIIAASSTAMGDGGGGGGDSNMSSVMTSRSTSWCDVDSVGAGESMPAVVDVTSAVGFATGVAALKDGISGAVLCSLSVIPFRGVEGPARVWM
jgi:hypothetical protein